MTETSVPGRVLGPEQASQSGNWRCGIPCCANGQAAAVMGLRDAYFRSPLPLLGSFVSAAQSRMNPGNFAHRPENK
ncbi:MAG: hypothetical protein ACXVZR_13245 [Terriglobales bacterium]